MDRIQNQPGRHGSQGFSLMELTVSLGLLALLALLILPNIARLTAKQRVSDTSRQIQSVLQLARMKAISERTNYTVQFSNRQISAWADTNGNKVKDSGEKSIYNAPLKLPQSLNFGYPAGADDQTKVRAIPVSTCQCAFFRSDGTMENTLSGTTIRSLAVGDGREYRQISVSEAGSVTVQKWAGGTEWR